MNRCRILLGLTISLMALPATTCAASGQSTELTYADGQKALVVLPEDYDPDRQYPCVCFMPQDGYSNQAYLEDGTLDRIRDLETDGDMEEMIFVFPGYQKGEDLFDQTEELLKAVEEELPVSREPSKRGVIGTGAGGYMAFLLTYVSSGGEILKEPEFFSAAASHDGDFVSGDNPYLEEYGSICGILKEKISSFGADTQWLRNYYTYLDCSLGTEHSWAEGGSCDIASLYRNAGLSDENSPQAWDYSVFEYVIQDPVRYGSWTDHLERSLKGFSQAFFTEEATREMPEETEKPYTAMETVSVGEDRRIDLMGDWYFCTADAVEKQNPGIDASSAGEILAVDWSAWDVVQPGLDWWTEDFAACLNRNPYYAGYAWYVREFEVPEEFDRTCLQIEAGMMDEGDEVYINGERVGQTGIPDEGGRYDGTNPWDVERVPGGSGGGSAAAVSSFEAPLALGTDTGGSIRQPGALTGTVGVKPTYGGVSRFGAIAMASSLDQIGPVTRTVLDSALLQEIIGGHDKRDSTSIPEGPRPMVAAAREGQRRDLKGLKVGLVKELNGEGFQPGVEARFHEAVDMLTAMGAEVVEVSCPNFKYSLGAYYIIMPSEVSSNLARYDGMRYGLRVMPPEDVAQTAANMMAYTREAGFGDEVKRRLILGTYALSAGYYDAWYGSAQKVRTLIINDFKKAFEQADVLVSPTSPTTAFKFGEKMDDPLAMYMNDIATIPANLAGVPAMSIPAGLSDDGLPVGFQFIAPQQRDEVMYKPAAALEAALEESWGAPIWSSLKTPWLDGLNK